MSFCIKRLFFALRKNQTKNYQDDREKTCDTLFQMLQSVFDLEGSPRYITNGQAESIGVRVEEMTLVDKSSEYILRPSEEEFFRPLSVEALNVYPLDENNEEAKRLSEYTRCWLQRSKPLEEFHEMLGESLVQLAHARRRDGTREHATTTLWRVNKWRARGLCPDIINEYYTGMLSLGKPFTQYCDINYSSASAYSRENEPHVLLVLHHYYEGNDNLSRGELLSILAAMVTQMEHDYLKSHCITPVLVISFMKSFQGRILQAHVTNNALLIQKSKLLTFRTQEEFDRSMSLCLRWMASDRVGNTRKQVRLDRPQEKLAAVTGEAPEHTLILPPTDKEPENVTTKIEEGNIGNDNAIYSIEAQGKRSLDVKESHKSIEKSSAVPPMDKKDERPGNLSSKIKGDRTGKRHTVYPIKTRGKKGKTGEDNTAHSTQAQGRDLH